MESSYEDKNLSLRVESFRKSYIEICNREGLAIEYDTIGLANSLVDIRQMKLSDNFEFSDSIQQLDYSAYEELEFP